MGDVEREAGKVEKSMAQGSGGYGGKAKAGVEHALENSRGEYCDGNVEGMNFGYWRQEVPVCGGMGEEHGKGVPVRRIATHQRGHDRGIALLAAG